MRKSLIITAGNESFFPQLKNFVRSLRNKGNYVGRVIVCDNTIEGSWDNPSSYCEIASFDKSQEAFFREYNVTIVPFHELIARHGITRRSIERITIRTARYPFKFIYTCLISKEYLNCAEYICFFDADVYFQKPISALFNELERNEISIVGERKKVGMAPFMKEWIRTTDLSFGTDQDTFLRALDGSHNYCTGFIGGGAQTFNRFVLLCWMLADSRLAEFYSDQPLVNILHSFFGYPINELGKEWVTHLGDLPKESIRFRQGQLLYKNTAPVAVHFNGGDQTLYEHFIEHTECKGPDQYYVEGVFQRGVRKLRRVYRTARQLLS